MLRCQDNSLYTGITTDLSRRMNEHFNKKIQCAKYTLYHTAKKLEASWETEDRRLASKLEYQIKKLSKLKKEELVGYHKTIEEVLGNKVEFAKYKRIDIHNIAICGDLCYNTQ